MQKNKLASQMDGLDITDKHYDRKYQDMQDRMYAFYDDIESVENEIEAHKKQISVIREQKIKGENVYQFLALYDIMYKNFTDAEKIEKLCWDGAPNTETVVLMSRGNN